MLRVQMRMELSNLHHDLAATMIYVTHDQVEAMTMADRIVVLDQGVIRQVGAPMELYSQPADRFVAAFIGSPSMNFLPAKVVSGGEMLRLALGPDAKEVVLKPRRAGPVSAAEVDLGLRPEHVTLVAPDAPEAVLAARVRLVERLGNQTLVHLDTPAGAVTLQGAGDLAARPGDLASLAFDAARAHAFAPGWRGPLTGGRRQRRVPPERPAGAGLWDFHVGNSGS